MSGFLKSVHLTQHTPLIHFQLRQAQKNENSYEVENENKAIADNGAALRATEVKPKLDKYISGLPDFKTEYVIKGKNACGALQYKLRIEGRGTITPIGRNTPYDIYYGNAQGIFYQDGITLKVICHNRNLMDCICNHIDQFFICTNFGQMQSKGFGSFTVDKIDGMEKKLPDQKNICQILSNHYNVPCCYYWVSQSASFQEIKTVYGIMKSGYNFRKNYCRSKLFRYMHSQNPDIPNEKAGLKAMGFAGNPPYCTNHSTNGEHILQPNKTNYYYVRALLGVGSAMKFQIAPSTFRNVNGTSNNATYSVPIEVKDAFLGKNLPLSTA